MMRKREQRKVFPMDPIRGSFIFVILLLVFLSVVLASAETHETISRKLEALGKIQGSFTFAVIGDTRSGGNDYSKIAQRLMEHKPAFVVNTGDVVFYPDRMLWADFWELSKPITVPYFLTAGNHDVDDSNSEELYKEQVDLPGNELYYSFSAGDSLFIVLDSNIPGQDRRIMGEQYEWLEKTLATSGKKYIFVFVHHPFYPDKECGRHYGGCLDKYQQERDRIEALLEKSNVTIVFAGHEHIYFREKVGRVMHIITGGGGAPLYSEKEKGGFYHFVLVTVSGNRVKGEAIDIDGKVRDAFEIPE